MTFLQGYNGFLVGGFMAPYDGSTSVSVLGLFRHDVGSHLFDFDSIEVFDFVLDLSFGCFFIDHKRILAVLFGLLGCLFCDNWPLDDSLHG